jgi:hypothetical protein
MTAGNKTRLWEDTEEGGKRSHAWVRIKDRAVREKKKVGGLAVQNVTLRVPCDTNYLFLHLCSSQSLFIMTCIPTSHGALLVKACLCL